MKGWSIALAGAAFALILEPAAAQEKIRIGMIVDFSGPFATVGTMLRQGAETYTFDHGAKVGGREVEWIFRDVDSQTQPTKGTTSLGMLTAGRSYATLSEEGYFTRAYAKVVGYLPLPWEWRAIGRFELGQVFARDAVSIPDTMLFRAGGDDSVRGYPYRSLGVEKNGAIIGGRSIATGSIELAHPLTKKLPALLGAVFLDVGDAAERFGNLQPNVGYGFGVRFLSPVGPLRLDLAYGTKVERWRMHFSVGVTL